ncbi:MAG: hypothetical protein ACK559_34805, partial [bacterium]
MHIGMGADDHTPGAQGPHSRVAGVALVLELDLAQGVDHVGVSRPVGHAQLGTVLEDVATRRV